MSGVVGVELEVATDSALVAGVGVDLGARQAEAKLPLRAVGGDLDGDAGGEDVAVTCARLRPAPLLLTQPLIAVGGGWGAGEQDQQERKDTDERQQASSHGYSLRLRECAC